MQYKNFILAFICLIALAFSTAEARICKTGMGIAWCENSKCYWKDGSGTFNISSCSNWFTKSGRAHFQGSNCRKCARKSCAITQARYTGTLNYYHSSNGYRLTANGWCYYG